MARAAVCGMCALIVLSQSATSAPQLQLLDTISGDSFVAIQEALPLLQNRGLTPEGYKISVWRTPRSIAVMFDNPRGRVGSLAEGGRKANFRAELPLQKPAPMQVELPLPPEPADQD